MLNEQRTTDTTLPTIRAAREAKMKCIVDYYPQCVMRLGVKKFVSAVYILEQSRFNRFNDDSDSEAARKPNAVEMKTISY